LPQLIELVCVGIERLRAAKMRATLVVVSTLAATGVAQAPFHWKKPETARWMAKTLDWGFLSTISTRSDASSVGDAFGNPYAFADASTGVPYFYASMLDASMIDLFVAKGAKPRASLTLSEAEITSPDFITRQYCNIGTYLGDPENPPCARLVLSGSIVKLEANTTDEKTAKDALFSRHPSFKKYPPSHDFFVAKMEVDAVWLIDWYGGAAIISPQDYFAVKLSSSNVMESTLTGTKGARNMPRGSLSPPTPPPYDQKAATARWMVRSLDWGVLSTVSTRSEGTRVGDAFGNPNSFVDGGSGVPYFYVSDMDASMIDAFGAKDANPRVSLALSEAELTGTEAARPDCVIGASTFGDPENPPCARLVLSGQLSRVKAGSHEEEAAKAALFKRHPSFEKYPDDHHFYVAKLNVDGIWLIDFYGGAAIISPRDYFAANSTSAPLGNMIHV